MAEPVLDSDQVRASLQCKISIWRRSASGANYDLAFWAPYVSFHRLRTCRRKQLAQVPLENDETAQIWAVCRAASPKPSTSLWIPQRAFAMP
jgi:hypothetical protein